MKKKNILLVLIFAFTIALSSSAFAGGYAAFLYVRWVECLPNGKVKNVVLADESVMAGMKADVIYPDGTKHESKYDSYYDQQFCGGKVKNTNDNCYVKHLIIADDYQPVEALQAGDYKISSDFDVPAGYEFDDSAASGNNLKVTLTQKDINDYIKLADHGAGNLKWVIDIPVKKQGKQYKIEEEIIQPSQEFVYYGNKTTVIITSNRKSKLTVVGRNARAKKTKNVRIKNGKVAKLVFGKKAAKGKYVFQVTANKTVKKITIQVK